VEIGLYGKLPTHGDFLRRRVPDVFAEAWDSWLQQSIAASRSMLADRWLDAYLTSPVWRFALSAGVCGPEPVAGVLAPSVDRVGRYFPLTLVWTAPRELTALELALRYQRWFEQAEQLLIDTLALEQIDFAAFDVAVAELDGHLEPLPAARHWHAQDLVPMLAGQGAAWRLPLPAASQWGDALMQLLGAQIRESFNPLAIWWTEGSAAIDPSGLFTSGLPAPQRFAAMLDGSWAASEWAEVGVEPATEPGPGDQDSSSAPADAVVQEKRLRCRSAGRTDVGTARSSNQDAYLERPELGLWALADGMGGLSHGELASRMVCDALAELHPRASLDDLVEEVSRSLERVNEYLRRSALRATNAVQSGSTVVALLISGKQCAVLWAGDSRAYRLRDGLLSQLMTDHSWKDPGGGIDAQAITRAVGGEDALDLEVLRTDARTGDRFLLCSDGLYRVLDVAEILRGLAAADPAASCSALIARALELGATDNVTVVVVDSNAADEGADADGQQ
jgi:type VI secretion system protein ImpM